MSRDDPKTRRNVLALAAAIPAGALLAASPAARASGTMPKANVHYQETPKGKADCGACTYFLPAAKGSSSPMCKIVAGPVQSTGWCTLYAAKPA